MSEFLNRPRFQFSLRGLLIAMTVVAILLGLVVFPLGQIIVGLLLAVLLRGVLPTVAVAAAIYGRGRLQAFAIGAVVSCLPILFGDLGPLSFFGLIAALVTQLVAAAVCGIVAVATREWLVRQGGTGLE